MLRSLGERERERERSRTKEDEDDYKRLYRLYLDIIISVFRIQNAGNYTTPH